MKQTVEMIKSENCTGCMMCGDICPKNAITFPLCDDRFWYPKVDSAKCIGCNLCAQKCPSIHGKHTDLVSPVVCFGAKTKNKHIREQSTSGGIFSELALEWMKSGGLCCGAEYDERNDVVHVLERYPSGIQKLRQSKYVQSRTATIYKAVGEQLRGGKRVFFCGTPCQVAAVKSYLGGREYGNLLTMDFVCCGICSPFIYRKYLDMLEKKYHSSIKRVWFKNKKKGWRSIGTEVEFMNGKRYFRVGSRDLYMVAFVMDALSMRSSCSHCKYRKIPHDSDITVADFWGVEKIKPEMDDNQGISAVIINTAHGAEWFEKIKMRLDCFETNVDQISAGNFTIYEAKKPSVNRESFLQSVATEPFDKVMREFGSYTGIVKLQRDLHYYKTQIAKTVKSLGG